MTEDDKLSALFRDDGPIADDGFTRRVIALAALEDRLAAKRHRAVRRLGVDFAALTGILAAFAALARIGPSSPTVAIGSPAMVGLLLLASWLAFGLRDPSRA